MNAVTVATAAQKQQPSLLGQSPGELLLRIHGTEYDGQIVRIKSAKCVIGSAPNCTLRLRSRFVQPHQCVILRGASRTIVRRWARSTQLNGAGFDDAPLSVGDRLAIGPIELEVVNNADLVESAPDPLTESRSQTAQESSSSRIEQLEQALVQKERECAGLSDERNRVAAAANQLRQSLDELRKKLAEQQRRAAESEDDGEQGRPPSSAKGGANIDSAEREKLLKQIEQLKQDRARLAAHIERSEKIYSKAAEIETKVSQIEAELTSARQAKRSAEQQRDQMAAELSALRGQASGNPAAAVDVAPSEKPGSPSPPATEAGANVLQPTSVQLASTLDLSELKHQLDSLDAPSSARLQSPTAAPAAPEPAPAGTIESAEYFEGSERIAAPGDAAIMVQADAANEQTPTSAAARGRAAGDLDDEMESIEDYMTRLMARVGGEPTADSKPSAGDSTVKKKRPATPVAGEPPLAAAPTPDRSSEALPPLDAHADGVSLKPHHLAPENRDDFEKMRDLANTTARSAIGAQADRRRRRTVLAKSLSAVLSLTSSAACLYWAMSHQMATAYLGAAVGLVFTTIWTAQAALLGRRMKPNR